MPLLKSLHRLRALSHVALGAGRDQVAHIVSSSGQKCRQVIDDRSELVEQRRRTASPSERGPGERPGIAAAPHVSLKILHSGRKYDRGASPAAEPPIRAKYLNLELFPQGPPLGSSWRRCRITLVRHAHPSPELATSPTLWRPVAVAHGHQLCLPGSPVLGTFPSEFPGPPIMHCHLRRCER
jgi:hypothetical protein